MFKKDIYILSNLGQSLESYKETKTKNKKQAMVEIKWNHKDTIDAKTVTASSSGTQPKWRRMTSEPGQRKHCSFLLALLFSTWKPWANRKAVWSCWGIPGRGDRERCRKLLPRLSQYYQPSHQTRNQRRLCDAPAAVWLQPGKKPPDRAVPEFWLTGNRGS